MTLGTLRDLYVNEIRDIYDAENEIVKALPKMIEASSSAELRTAFQHHLRQTEQQVDRLERVFDMLGEKAKGRKCQGIRGIISEGEDILDADAGASIMDAALIAAAQRVEHYEIAAYGTCCAYAKQLGFDDQLKLLLETLEEEKETDEKLTQIAETVINVEAVRQAG
jgi:ferritin-like metal-binding protein YciE